MILTPQAQCQRLIEALAVDGGRATAMVLPMPDGSVHIEGGMSIKLTLALHIMSSSMAADPDRRRNTKQHAELGIDGAKMLLRMMAEDAKAEAAKAAATAKVLAETKGDDAV